MMNDPDNPLVSVMCATYNHEKYIRYALNGFVMQETNFPFEVIVHDDASTDGTADIIREYEAKFPHIIKPIYQTENQYSKKVKIGKEIMYPKARGKYFAMCEGDDFWIDKNKLQKQADYLENHPEASCVFHPVHILFNEKAVKNDKRWNTEMDFSAYDVIVGSGSFIYTPSLFCRKDIALKFPKFRQIANVGDYPLQILLSLKGKVHYLPDIMACYRSMTEGSWSSKFANDENFYINHWLSEIKWLMQLNKDTNSKHQLAVSYRIFLDMQMVNSRNALQREPYMHKVYSETEKQLHSAQMRIIEKVAAKLSKMPKGDINGK